eukprot:1810674-Amphidinium_carterae.1
MLQELWDLECLRWLNATSHCSPAEHETSLSEDNSAPIDSWSELSSSSSVSPLPCSSSWGDAFAFAASADALTQGCKTKPQCGTVAHVVLWQQVLSTTENP